MNKPSVQGSISVTNVSSSTKIGKRHILLRNSGSKTAYIRLNDATATTSDFVIAAGVTITLDTDEGSQIYSVQAICSGADVTTLQYLAWD